MRLTETPVSTGGNWQDHLAKAWLNGPHPHVRVRVVLLGVLALLALFGVLRGVLSQQWLDERQMDVDVLQSVYQQRLSAQQLGVALDASGRGVESIRQLEAAGPAMVALHREFLRMDALVSSRAAPEALYAEDLGATLAEWRAAQQILWTAYQQQHQEQVWMPSERARLSEQVQRAGTSLDVLSQAVSTHIAQRSRQWMSMIWTIVAGTLLVGLLLAFALAMPMARAVRQQYETMTRQGNRLKRLAKASEISSNAIAITDAMHQIVWVNQAFADLMGYTLESARGRRIGTLLKARSPESMDLVAFTDALRCGQGLQHELRLTGRDGSQGWMWVDMQPIREGDEPVSGWAMAITDLTEVRTQQETLSLAVSGAGLGIWHWDLVYKRVGWNARMQHMLGFPDGVLIPQADTWMLLIHPDDIGLWKASLRQHLHNVTNEHRLAVRLRHFGGAWVWILFVGRAADPDGNGRYRRMAGVAMDVNAQKSLEQQLWTAARTDQLTNLPNRTVLVEQIQSAIDQRRAEPDYQFAVLFMDFDRFKQVNDTLGHSVGDTLLRHIARRLEDCLQSGNSVGIPSHACPVATRIGGDEFVVLLKHVRDEHHAAHVAARLLDVLAAPYELHGHWANATVSIGVVTSALAADDVDSILRDADIAMYEAKRAGRDRYVIFEPPMRLRVRDAAELESDLRQALKREELHVVYQPLVRLRDQSITGMEALVRWRHPTRGLVSPEEFIPLAETSGLIVAMGDFVLRTACRDFQWLRMRLGAAAPMSVSVNLSRAQLSVPHLPDIVQAALHAAAMQPDQLVLEVTESFAAQDSTTQHALRALRALGVSLSLDDFGTGYSSLACLQELPVNSIKIDRAFTARVDHSEYHRVLIEATLRVATALALETLAEGVETQAQAQQLTEMGCAMGQGYWFGRPMDIAVLENWITAHAPPHQEIMT